MIVSLSMGSLRGMFLFYCSRVLEDFEKIEGFNHYLEV